MLDSLISSLRDIIERGDSAILVEGRLLPERELAEHLSVGRRQLRQALAILEDDGLLYRRQGQGTFVQQKAPRSQSVVGLSNRTNPQEMLEVRKEVEPILARLAAMRASRQDIEQMERLAQRGTEAESGSQYERWDGALHAKIAESARNALFLGVYEFINAVRADQPWRRTRESTFSLDLRDKLILQHFAIIDAIKERKPATAEAAMRDHLMSVGKAFEA